MSEGGEKRLFEQSKTKRFERIVAPHIAAAYNLARWLLQNDQDAEDVVQETCLLAYKHLDFLRGEEARAWLLKIARNESYDWLRRNKPMALNVSLDERNIELSCESHNPEQLAMLAADSKLLREGLGNLPLEFRETLVLRELEGFNYKEIAEMIDIPIGTVMSRLARGRKRLQGWLISRMSEEMKDGL